MLIDFRKAGRLLMTQRMWQVNYIIANPGTYMYLDDQRLNTTSRLKANSTCPSVKNSTVCGLTAADFSRPWNGGMLSKLARSLCRLQDVARYDDVSLCTQHALRGSHDALVPG